LHEGPCSLRLKHLRTEPPKEITSHEKERARLFFD
jgi:hypothetical protein